jgi:hypothetical protein
MQPHEMEPHSHFWVLWDDAGSLEHTREQGENVNKMPAAADLDCGNVPDDCDSPKTR